MTNTPTTDAEAIRFARIMIEWPNPGEARTTELIHADFARGLERTLARYEHAFDNILTLIDGKVDTVDGERSDLDPPSANDYGQIQQEIDQARSGK